MGFYHQFQFNSNSIHNWAQPCSPHMLAVIIPIHLSLMDNSAVMWSKFHIRWLSALLGGFTIIERSWNSGNLPYIVANTYGFNFIKIRGIWTFHRGHGDLYFATKTLSFHTRAWPIYGAHLPLYYKESFDSICFKSYSPNGHTDRKKHRHDESITSLHMRALINCLWTNSKTIIKLYNNSNRPPVDKQHSYNKTVPYTATTTDHLWTNSTAMI